MTCTRTHFSITARQWVLRRALDLPSAMSYTTARQTLEPATPTSGFGVGQVATTTTLDRPTYIVQVREADSLSSVQVIIPINCGVSHVFAPAPTDFAYRITWIVTGLCAPPLSQLPLWGPRNLHGSGSTGQDLVLIIRTPCF